MCALEFVRQTFQRDVWKFPAIDEIMAEPTAHVIIKFRDLTTLRQTIKVIGSFITETKIEFTEHCMRITDIDTTKTFMVDFKLKAENIRNSGGKYILHHPCSVGINVNQFERELNSLLPDGDVVITAEHDKYLRFVNYTAPPSKIVQQFIIQGMDLDQDKYDALKLERPSASSFEGGAMTTISSSALFSQLAAKSKSLGDVEIRLSLNKDGFQISGVSLNDLACSAVNFGGGHMGKPISNIFVLKHLQKMAAAEKVDRSAQIYLKSNAPVMFVYKPKTLGTLKLVLSHRNRDDEEDDPQSNRKRKRDLDDEEDDEEPEPERIQNQKELMLASWKVDDS